MEQTICIKKMMEDRKVIDVRMTNKFQNTHYEDLAVYHHII